MEKLKRDNLIKILDEMAEIKKSEIAIEQYKNFFDVVEGEINNHMFEYDNRFVTYGRRNFLQREFVERLNKNDYLGALINLEEYIRDYTSFLTPVDLPTEETRGFHDVLKANDDYFRDGIICLQEKNIIVEMISEFKSRIML